MGRILTWSDGLDSGGDVHTKMDSNVMIVNHPDLKMVCSYMLEVLEFSLALEVGQAKGAQVHICNVYTAGLFLSTRSDSLKL